MRPKKVINISMQRSATQSFDKFALAKGFYSKHYLSEEEYLSLCSLDIKSAWKEYLKLITPFEAISDTPIPLFIKNLYRQYPNESFVLFTRDPHDWANSVRNHLDYLYSVNRYHSKLDQLTYNVYMGKSISIDNITENDFISIYNNYLSYSKEMAFKLGISIKEIELSSTSISENLNQIFDLVKPSDFKEFPLYDHLKIWGQSKLEIDGVSNKNIKNDLD